MSVWVIAALAIVGLALLVTAIVLLVRARRRAPAPPTLTSVWGRFLARLPASARGDPVIVVLGERLAGKSRLVEAALELDARPALAGPGAPDDPRLTCYAGRGVLVQEISADLLGDARPEARDALRRLWGPIGLDAPLVLCVIDTRAPSWAPAGVERLGALARDKIDLLTAIRGSPPRVRVCLTHLDASAEGFVEIAGLARRAGLAAALTPAGHRAPELAASLAPLDAHLPSALRELTPAELGRLTRFSTATGPRVVSALAPFLTALLAARPGAPAPVLDGVVLAGLPQGGAAAMVGDALALDAATVDRDARALDRRRTAFAIVAAAAVAALLACAYAWHFYAVERADQAVRRFVAAAQIARKKPEKGWSSDGDVRAAERDAADALDAALAPLFPPLRLAYPGRKQGLAETFLQQIREIYLLPAARGPDRARRIYALSLLYASSDDALGAYVRASPQEWATFLDMPARVVDDYLTWSERPWTGAADPPSASGGEVTLDDWRGWLVGLDAALRRDKITPDELDALQKKGKRLEESVGRALVVRGLERAVALLEEARGPQIDVFLGRGDLERAPRWVSESWEKLDALLTLVDGSSLAVPAARGKSLRGLLDDIAGIAGADAGDAAGAYELVLDGEVHVYRTDAWKALIRASRAALCAEAFVDDVTTSGRSPFFVRPSDYPQAGAPSSRSRGPLKSIPGVYTARAVGAEVKPALAALDPTLDAARLPLDDRVALTRLVMNEMAHYASAYRAALWDYIASFRLDVTSPAGLRSDLEDMVGPASWLTTFWVAVSDNASLDAGGNPYLGALVDALGPFQPLVGVMAGDKGKYPLLDKYYAVIATLVPSIDAGSPAPPGPPGAALADRLPPLGKLGVAILDTTKPAPRQQVTDWLDASRLLDRSLRQPFLDPVDIAYTYALTNVETTLDQAYRTEIRPLVAPLLGRFPFDPRAATEASPDELVAVVGPKGSFRAGLELLLGPVCKKTGDGKAGDGSCLPRAPVGFRAVRLPGDAVELWGWSAALGGVLWDDGGKPKPLVISGRPRPLPEVTAGEDSIPTRSFLRAGSTTVYGFNQSPTWQTLSIDWSTSAAAVVGVERTDRASGEKLEYRTEGEGGVFRFYRVLCKAQEVGGGRSTWGFNPPISFELEPEPWALVVPPGNRGRRCVQFVARN